MEKNIIKIRMPYSDWLKHKRLLTDQEIEKIENSMTIKVYGRYRRDFVEYNSTKEFEAEYDQRAIRLLDIPMTQIRAGLEPMSENL